MARYSGSHRAPHQPARYEHHERKAAAGDAVLLVVIAVLSGWAHHSLSTARPVAPNTTATPSADTTASPLTSPPLRVQLRTWLTRAEPSIDALVDARHEIASAAANHDITGTSAACRTADGAVANLQHNLPSPDPALTAALQKAISLDSRCGNCVEVLAGRRFIGVGM
jgi:hypothetical protein